MAIARALAWALALLVAPHGVASELATSETSVAAAARVEPGLRAAFADAGLEWGAPIFIRAFKESAELELWVLDGERFELFRTYPICALSGELGPKLAEGDRQVPEGFYFVNAARMNPNSSWHLSMNVGYPNEFDAFHGRTGSYIMIHGACGSSGCLSMTDAFIEDIYTLAAAALEGGQPFFRVHVFPFRMTDAAMAAHADSEWLEFWNGLREGYSWFERSGFPPDTSVDDGRYVFSSGVESDGVGGVHGGG